MLVPVWGVGLIGTFYLGLAGIYFLIPMLFTLSIIIFEVVAVFRHIRVWRFKEMYYKIYQGLSVLIVDGDLRLDPEKLNDMIISIEQSALTAICTDPAMRLMVGTLSRIIGIAVPENVIRHELDIDIQILKEDRFIENHRNGKIFKRWY